MKVKLHRVLCAAAAMLFVSMFSALGVSAEQDTALPQEPEVSQVSGDTVKETEPLTADIKLSARKIYEGDTVKVSVNAQGDSGKYTYKCTAKNLVSGKTVFSEKSENPEFMVRFGKPENYLIKATVYDENGQKLTVEKNITICKALPFVEKGTAVDTSRALPGGTITVTANAAGGKKPYMYKYILKDSETGKVISSKNEMSPTAQFTIPEGEPKFYKIRTEITDMKNNIVSKTIEVASYKQDTAAMSVDGSRISERYVAVGKELTATIKAGGGTAPYKYKAFYKSETDRRWTECIPAYQYSSSVKVKLPKTEGKYRVKIAAIDLNGRYAEKELSVFVKEFTLDNSFLSSSKAYVGSVFNIVAVAQYANGPVKYRYCRREAGKEWEDAAGYTSTANQGMVFTKAGKYEIRIEAFDGSGNRAEKTFSVDAVEMDVSGSTADKTFAAIGEGVTISAAVKNNNGSAKYHYSYSTDGTNWKYMGDYITSPSYQFKFDSVGTYYIRVGVRDKNGDGIYKEKRFKVDIYDPNAKTTTAATVLQKDASWKGSALCAVPYGSKVIVIKTEGRWYYVKYNGKFGYIYNMALGTARNYSGITTSSLPAVADDILFTKGKAINTLFNYVNSMGYRSVGNSSLENLCVHILTYRCGACYHRAALLYYLLDRAGYDVVRVTDGIDMATGGSPHNWCIIKTANGWRHIDPTPVIGLPTMYLVTDGAISPYFSWNRTKYPACR